MIVVADDDRCGEGAAVDPAQGSREQATLAVEEVDELLGIHAPRQRP